MAATASNQTEAFTVAIAMVFGELGAAFFQVLPGLVAALKLDYGFDESKLGYLSSGHLIGLAIGSAVGTRLISQLGLSRTARLGVLIAAAAYAAAIPFHSYRPLLTCMVLTGLGTGMAIAAFFKVLGGARHVDRCFSIFNMFQLAVGAAALKLMPLLLRFVGVGGLFAVLSLLFAVSLMPAGYLSSATQSSPTQRGLSGRLYAPALMALAALLIYFAGQGVVWTYLELIGEWHRLPQPVVVTAVAASSLFGLAGATLAAIIASTFGRALPIFLGLCTTVVSLYFLGSSLDAKHFVVVAGLFNLAWNFSSPYFPAVIANADRSGRVMNWVAFITLVGVSVGQIAGALVISTTGLLGVLSLSAALCLLSFVAVIPACVKGARRIESP